MGSPDVALRRVRALSARTHFVPGYGQVHFDPDSASSKVRYPEVPEEAVAFLVKSGWVADDYAEGPAAAVNTAASIAPANPLATATVPAGAAGSSDIKALRAEYREVIGKSPFGAWSAEELTRRIAEARAAATAPAPNAGQTGEGAEGDDSQGGSDAGSEPGNGADGADGDAPPIA